MGWAAQNACSFGGSSLFGPELILLLAVVVAALLAPVGIGAVLGWRNGRRAGRPWIGALRGAAWVLAGYAVLLAIAWVALKVEQWHRVRQDEAELALLDPVLDVQPDDWSALIADADPAMLPAASREAWAWEVIGRVQQPLPWSTKDLDALGHLAADFVASPTLRHQGWALTALVAFARDGEAGVASARAGCAGETACESGMDDAFARADAQRIAVAEEQGLTGQAQPLPRDVREALDRLLVRQRMVRADWGLSRLAFDRVVRGGLAHAVEACGVALPMTEPKPPGDELKHCWLELLRLLDLHGAARLCPQGGGIDPGDRELLAAWQAAWPERDPPGQLEMWIPSIEAECGSGEVTGPAAPGSPGPHAR